MVGWPPVRGSRKNVMKSCKFIKVGLDGAPYLRKLDLEMYNSYHQLLVALQGMFSSCLTIRMYFLFIYIFREIYYIYEDKGDLVFFFFVKLF